MGTAVPMPGDRFLGHQLGIEAITNVLAPDDANSRR
jgi:hypothetical protein